MEPLYTAAEYAEWLKSRVGDPYWYGTYFNKCTESKLQSKAKQFPSHYGSSRMPKYRQDIAAGKMCGDCVGAGIKGPAWSKLGTQPMKYASNGVPDKSADGMFEYCKKAGAEWGTMGTMPDQQGVAVRYSGHVGVYVGSGFVVEWRGFAYGCVITRLKDRKWTHWYKLPWVEYCEEKAPEHVKTTLGSRLLKRGSKGEDVRELQTLLVEKMGYSVGSAGCDGDFGKDTEYAVKRLQSFMQIKNDGEYGDETHMHFMEIIAQMISAEEEAEEDQAAAAKVVVITGDGVNIRAGASTKYAIITVLNKNDELVCIGVADNGWNIVAVNGQTGFVSGKYSEVKA